jgi:hypothetical protein
VASSRELLAFSKNFQLRQSWRHPYLKHAQDLCIWQRTLFVVSAGCDCVLSFDLDQGKFLWAMHISRKEFQFIPRMIDPDDSEGPLMLDQLHLTSVYCDANGMYISGTNTGGMLHFNGRKLNMSAELPAGTHNARPFRAGVLFNDSEAGVLRYAGRKDLSEDRAMTIPSSPVQQQAGDSNTGGERPPAGGRGLCVLSNSVIAGGSTPATVTVYDLAGNRQLTSVTLTSDTKHSIHSVAVWPFG